MIDLYTTGLEIMTEIRNASWFPVKTGATRDSMVGILNGNTKEFEIVFNRDPNPEIVHYLETGTMPHDIPNAFGKGENFGIGGRFDGKFHPGSTKHIGFISNKSVNTAIQYICNKYGGYLV